MNRGLPLHDGDAEASDVAEFTTHGIGYEWKLTAPGGDEVETLPAVAAVLLLIQLQILGRGGME